MAKELPFFKFEISEWMFGRIQKQPLDIQGVFINLCCKYWHKLGEYSYEDAELDFTKESLDMLVQSRIISNESGYLVIKFLDIQLDECEQNSQKQRIKGLRSAQLRAARKLPKSTVVEPLLNPVEPNPTEENRREEKREEEINRKKFSEDYYQSKEQAFEEMKQDDLYMDEVHRTVTGKGWRVATKVHVLVILKKFLIAKADLESDKKNVRQHFKNYLFKEQVSNLVQIADEG